jgi:hypothetical protein
VIDEIAEQVAELRQLIIECKIFRAEMEIERRALIAIVSENADLATLQRIADHLARPTDWHRAPVAGHA